MRRNDIDGREENLAGSSPSAVGSDRRLGSVIQFTRKTEPTAAAGSGLAAGDTPPVSSALFLPLGPIVQAVVIRLQGDRVRIKALVPTQEGEEDLDEL